MQGAENAQVHVFPFFAITYKTKEKKFIIDFNDQVL